MSEIPNIAVLTALAAGAVSFLSPCVLPLVPAYVSYVVGHNPGNEDHRAHCAIPAAALSLFFVLGFSTVFIALGASATALGQILLHYRGEASFIGGLIIILFGLFMVGVLKLAWLQRDLRFQASTKGAHPLGAYVIGLAFAFGWTPCIGPVLGAILTATAVSADTSNGIALLSVYAAGLGIPFIVTAMFARGALKWLKALRGIGRALQILAGAVMVLMGLAMIAGQTTAFALWLLRAFPALAALG